MYLVNGLHRLSTFPDYNYILSFWKLHPETNRPRTERRYFMRTETADRKTGTERLTAAIRNIALICAIIATSAALYPTCGLGVMFEGSMNVVFASEVVAEIIMDEQSEDGNTLSLADNDLVTIDLHAGGTTIAGKLADVSTLYAGGTAVSADELSASVTETKNSSTLVGLGDEGSNVHEDSIVTIEQETETEKGETGREFITGYTTSIRGLRIRALPNVESEILANKGYATEVSYAPYSDDWAIVDLGNGNYGYASDEFISDEKPSYATSSSSTVYADSRKSYMTYKVLTSWRQKDLQQMATTGNYGIRMYGGRYLVAIGQSFGASVGTYIDVILLDGTIIPCIMGDAKANSETMGGAGYTGMYGDTVEFIVDTSQLPSSVKTSGDISDIPGWGAAVKGIVVYQYNVFGQE